MSAHQRLQHVWAYWFAFKRHEDDPDFRAIILRLCRKGMVVAGALGVVSVFANLIAYAVAGYTPAWWYGTPNTIVLWDKIFIGVLSVSYLGLAQTRGGPRWGRLLGAGIALFTGIAILLDDIAQGGVFVSSHYLSMVMLVLIAALPYQPRQAFMLVFVASGVHLSFSWYLAEVWGITEAINPGLFVYMIIVLVLCTGLSALLYTVRYEQYLAHREAEQLGEQVAKMEQVKSRFFANISHEFRTPLSLILGPVEDALRDAYGPVSATLRRKLLLVQRSSLRLERLINQLLDLSKLEAGRMHLHVRSHNLNKFLSYLVASFSSMAERKHITLSFDPGASNPLLYFDADKLEQVITNLLSNALKFTPEHGKVLVGVREVGEDKQAGVEIFVRDTGRGIPNEALPYIFDRFHQVEEAVALEYIGTGIGLALSRELVEIHGGSISAESELGFGSTFLVRLPCGHAHFSPQDLVPVVDGVEADAVPAAEVAAAALEEGETEPHDDVEEGPADGAPTILVVDDEADMREYLHGLLGAHYHIEEASDGVEGLEKVRRIQPALVVSDVIMPKLDGFALCRAIKMDEALNHVPVILLTGRAEQEAEREGLEIRADDYIRKPFRTETFLARVENLIEIRRHLRQRFSEEVVLQPSAITVASADAEFLERVRAVVESQMEHSNFGVEWLADEVGVSPRHLQRKLRALTRLSAKGFINMMRLQPAAQLLDQQAGTIAEAAYAVGFQDASYFSKLFKQTFGVTPSVFGARTMGQKGHPS